MKKTLVSLLALTLLGCASENRLPTGQTAPPLSNQEGYLSVVLDSLNRLKNIEFMNKDTGDRFYVGFVEPGVSQITLQLKEGEYCFVGFDVVNLRMDYEDQGFCSYIEANEVNYMGDFIVRNPVTVTQTNFRRFVKLLKRDHPDLCDKYIAEGCAI